MLTSHLMALFLEVRWGCCFYTRMTSKSGKMDSRGGFQLWPHRSEAAVKQLRGQS